MNDYDDKKGRPALRKAALQFMASVGPYGTEAVFQLVDDHVKSMPSMQGWHRARILDAVQDVRDAVAKLLNRLDHLVVKETEADIVEGDQ